MTQRFQEGTGCFTCWYCNTKTRDTGNGESIPLFGGPDSMMCRFCVKVCEAENDYLGHMYTLQEYQAYLTELLNKNARYAPAVAKCWRTVDDRGA